MEKNINKGELVKKAVARSGMSVKFVAEKIGTTRRQMYNYFEKSDLNNEIIKKIGQVIKVDFSDEIPELKYYKALEVGTLPNSDIKKQLDSCIEDRDFWKSRAYEAANNLSDIKDIFYKLLFEASEKGIDTKDFMSQIQSIGSNRQ